MDSHSRKPPAVPVKSRLFELVPFNVAIINRDYEIETANGNFVEYFGDWQGRHCYEAYKGLSEPCPNCQTRETFADGLVRVSDESGVDRHGRTCHYVVHLAPVKNDRGEVVQVIEMSTDVTETKRWQREYSILFERAACYISVIDKDFRIIRANEAVRDTFGEVRGRFCYEAFKRRKKPCRQCPARDSFRDGGEHSASMVGIARDGSPAYYMVNTSALTRGSDGVAHIIEIATDVTRIHGLKEELREAHDLYASLIRNAADGILALDTHDRLRIINRAAKEIIGWGATRKPSPRALREVMPGSAFLVNGSAAGADFKETVIRSLKGGEIPVNLRTRELKSRGKRIGHSIYLQDLREVKRLEQEKLDAERLAAVGQTVAGLAHTIKNLLMGLEGGMYIVDSGLKRGDSGRIGRGWTILQRNFEKTTVLVRNFLEFSKGKTPQLVQTNPVGVARDVVELYRETAAKQGVELSLEAPPKMPQVPLDPAGMESCLTNLISNGIDAAMLSEKPGGRVILRVKKEEGALVYEVQDNGCGMEPEIQRRVFTTFFTTKGGKGTGLGLLTTRKIVAEHGGSIAMDSNPDVGSTFRITLPLSRLRDLWRALKNSRSRE